MPHRSRVFKTRVLKSKTEERTTELKKEPMIYDEEQTWRRTNNLTTKRGTIWQRRTATKNRGRTNLTGWLDDLVLICMKNSEDREEEEVKHEWGCRWEETRVFCRRWDALVSVDGFADGFSDVCAWLRRWVCMFGCESVLESSPMVMSALVSADGIWRWDLYVLVGT